MEQIRKNVVRSVFTVKEKKFLTPHYIRVVFVVSDQQIELFKNARAGENNKIFLPIAGRNTIVFPDECIADNEPYSIRRTYTTRYIDYHKKELWIDFVAHGDNGPASAWAIQAKAGAILGIAMKESLRPLFPDVEEYFLVGDSTALPVIGAILEQLPQGVKVMAILEVFGKEDEIIFCSKANLTIEWLHNPNPEKGSNIEKEVRKMVFPPVSRFVFVAAEFSTVKNTRNFFKQELEWHSHEYSIISYWKNGEREE